SSARSTDSCWKRCLYSVRISLAEPTEVPTASRTGWRPVRPKASVSRTCRCVAKFVTRAIYVRTEGQGRSSAGIGAGRTHGRDNQAADDFAQDDDGGLVVSAVGAPGTDASTTAALALGPNVDGTC